MPKRFSAAQMFLVGGFGLALFGFILGHALQIPSALPPYLPTAVLALTYGLFCWQRDRSSGSGKR